MLLPFHTYCTRRRFYDQRYFGHIFFVSVIASSLDSIDSLRSAGSVNTLIQPSEKETRTDYNGLDFKIIVDTKSGNGTSITLVAATRQEKLAWCSDISQVIQRYLVVLIYLPNQNIWIILKPFIVQEKKLCYQEVDKGCST